ncbi:Glycoside hydrolase 37, partial [Globisporangium splendens]
MAMMLKAPVQVLKLHLRTQSIERRRFPQHRIRRVVTVTIATRPTVPHETSTSTMTSSDDHHASCCRVTIPHPLAYPATNGEQELQQQLFAIYCSGRLLHDVQMNHVFADSKHFVDMPLKAMSDPATILHEYDEYIKSQGPGWMLLEQKERVVKLREFIDKHFDEPGADMTHVVPLDYQEEIEPPAIAAIENSAFREWAFQLHKLWKNLGRQPNPAVKSTFLHSKPVEHLQLHRKQNVLVVPGGRFRESYYWDSFWIVEGLLVSNMKETARSVVNNLLEYAAEFGFVPNGGRIYYLTRSQPPMLSDMVRLVATVNQDDADFSPSSPSSLSSFFEPPAEAAKYDLAYLQAVVPILEKEYAFWMQTGPSGHAVEVEPPVKRPRRGSVISVREPEKPIPKGKTYLLNRYVAHTDAPRPESFREDYHDADSHFGDRHKRHDTCETRAKKTQFYNEVIAGAESGWDFSARWFKDHRTLITSDTSNIIPVDLNVIMYKFEQNLAHFHTLLWNDKAAAFFKDAAARRAEAMHAILWNDLHQSWRDYLLDQRVHSTMVCVSDYSPLWVPGCGLLDTTTEAGKERVENIIESLRNSGLIQVGGIQSTTKATGQQWDAPNAWPPAQDIIIEGLLALDTKESVELATELMRTWVKAGFTAWQRTGLMFEKYNSTELGSIGQGGEYIPQFGFGWTNGVILKYLAKYQHFLEGLDAAN